MNVRAPLFLALLLGGCDGFPRDHEGTLDRVRSSGAIRVGLVTGDEAAEGEKRLLGELRRVTGGNPSIAHGPAELLLVELEQGELDMVIGTFAADSPWARRVTMGPVLAVRAEHGAEFHKVAAMRNGENRWIGLVEVASRNSAASPTASRQ